MQYLSDINFIQWGLLTDEQWRAISVANITEPSPKEHTKSSISTDRRMNTLYDPRLGEQREGVQCGTCLKYNMECSGHIGHIDLPVRIYNLVFIQIIVKLLQCVCPHCARPRILPDHIKLLMDSKNIGGITRLKNIADKCNKSITVCPWKDCGEPLIFFSLPEKGVIVYTIETKITKPKPEKFSAEEAYEILSRISFENLQLLGFNNNLLPNKEYTNPDYFNGDETYHHVHEFRPAAMFIKVFPILPTLARPFIQDDDDIKEDDLTLKYNNLLEAIKLYNSLSDGNEKTKKSTVSTRRGYVKTKTDIGRDIAELVWAISDNRDEKNKIQNGRKPHRSIACRLVGKEGRFQQNVAGKRTNFSARSVIIGGGIRLREDQLGVPQDVGETETKPIFVGPWNIEETQELVRQGKINCVVRQIKINTIEGVKFRKEKTILKSLVDKGVNFLLRIGDIADRHLKNGDCVIFNRQPTLWEGSMCSFSVKIIEGMAFMLNEAFTKGFNADFDGKTVKRLRSLNKMN